MKNLKQLCIILNLFFIASCGFSPMLKKIDLNSIKINKIEYSGPSGLVYFLKSNLNMPINKNLKNAYSLKFNINENSSSVTKDASGITTEEQIVIKINLRIFNDKNELIENEEFENRKVISVTNNISTDEELKRIEKENLITNLIQQLTLAVSSSFISNQK